jgi:hypothetical protein
MNNICAMSLISAESEISSSESLGWNATTHHQIGTSVQFLYTQITAATTV